jgi:deoxycytidine triphosphate deaminase
MILNSEEIKNLNIIESFDETKSGNASYDLSVEKIITMDDKECDSDSHYKMESQEMVWVICKEKITMPKDVIGFVHIKTGLTREGILSMNTGIIDPGYKGKISTLLINFGKAKKTISKNNIVLRVAFAKVNEHNNFKTPIVIDDDTYLATIRKSADNFAKTFLNMDAVSIKLYGLSLNMRNGSLLAVAIIIVFLYLIIAICTKLFKIS